MKMKRRTTTGVETVCRNGKEIVYTNGESDADVKEVRIASTSSGNTTAGGGGGTIGSYKVSLTGKRAQSILNSLLVTLLASLANFWNWLASRLNICVSTDQQSTFCANGTEEVTFTSSTVSISEIKPNDTLPTTRIKDSSSLEGEKEAEETHTKNIKKMTIEVSSDTMAKVNPSDSCMLEQEELLCDQGIVMKSHLHCSLPVLRLNSESFEEMQAFSEEEESSSDNNGTNRHRNRGGGNHSDDSCSDYCSGSGSPVPGSPNDLLQDDETFNINENKEDEVNHFIIRSTTATGAKEVSHPDGEDYEDNNEDRNQANIKNNSMVQSVLVRRDSDTSESSVNDEGHGDEDVPVPPEVASKIVSQVEAMFSDDHLAKDGFLLKHVRRRSDGFVSLKLVAGLRKVKQISREFPVVLTSLKQSDVLEVNSEGTKIRRKEPLTTVLKSLPIKQAKKEKSQSEKENLGANAGNNSSADEQQDIRPVNNKENIKSSSMRNNNQNQRNVQVANIPNNNPNSRRNSSTQYTVSGKGPASRKSSNVSTASSNNSTNNSRNNSFSTASGGRPHPADLFRHVMNAVGSSGEDSSQVVRRGRGGSLPISAIQSQHRGSISGTQLSPNSSPPNAASGFLRPKSNSYCEGTVVTPATANGMSPWLLRRKASVASSRLSCGDVVISGVIRQPRGPDGTKGFHSGYRALILEERLQMSQTSTCSA